VSLGPAHGSPAVLLRDLGDYDGARLRFERALAVAEAAYGPDHPVVATFSANYSRLLGET